MEIMCQVLSPLTPSFTPKMEVKSLPLVSGIAIALQSFFIPRAGTPEERNTVVEKIIQRQKDIEVEMENFPPLSIFAESTTTNGTRMLPFKRGAFQGMRTVTPSYF